MTNWRSLNLLCTCPFNFLVQFNVLNFLFRSISDPASSSSRSSILGSGLSSRSATTAAESDAELEALDNVRVVAR